MHGVRQWLVRLSILHKAIVLSCAFIIPILLVVGLLMNDFYDYREKSDRLHELMTMQRNYQMAIQPQQPKHGRKHEQEL